MARDIRHRAADDFGRQMSNDARAASCMAGEASSSADYSFLHGFAASNAILVMHVLNKFGSSRKYPISTYTEWYVQCTT